MSLFEQTLRTYVDGRVVQLARIAGETIWTPHDAISDIARHIIVVPGDVILTGVPRRSRSVDPGHHVDCEIASIGRLGGTVVAIDAPRVAALGVSYQPFDSPEVRCVALVFDEHVPEQFKVNLRTAKGGAA